MAELEAGLLAGFGLTAPSPAPVAQAEAMPSVQAPSAQPAGAGIGEKGSADEDMAELEAGLLAGFGLTAPPTPGTAVGEASTGRVMAGQANTGPSNAGQSSTGGQFAAAQPNAAQPNEAPSRQTRPQAAQADQAHTHPAQPHEPQADEAHAHQPQSKTAQPRRTPRRPEQTTPTARSEDLSFAEAPQPTTGRRPTHRTGPTQTSSDYVPGSRPVRKPQSPGPTNPTDAEIQPPAASTTVPVTTSAPISASAEAAQESFQELIGRPGGRAPEVAAPEPEAHEEAPLTEYTTTHADLDSARLNARVAARRRARSMAVLLIATIAAWVFSVAGSIPVFVPLAATLLLAAHAVASRTAAVRSRETLTMLAAHLYAAEMAREHAEKRRRTAEARTRARVEAEAAAPPPERVARRAAAVSADTWDPIPVPPPTYTLKPAVHRPPPPPLEPPAEKPQPSERQVSRGSMPRRAADIERILELEETELPRAVNE
ncbi:hypothetical protein [Kineosporia sp. NBRC 101677]|nr:hypothetical protein [Kineosporia sp. NBRC 101677]